MQLSENGIRLIQGIEDFRAQAYLDSKGVPTIGWGTTHINGVPVKLGMTCSREQADAWFAADCQDAVNAVNRLATVSTQNQFDALVSFVYNVGASAFSGSSLRHAINTGAPVTEDLWTAWNKVRDPNTNVLHAVDGLTNRRKREYQLYIS